MFGRVNAFVGRNYASKKALVRMLLGQLDLLMGRASPYTCADLGSVRRFVFVCLGNINRSAFAHVVAAGRGLPVASFGLVSSTGNPAFPRGVEVAAEMGFDMGAHVTTDISDFIPQPGDLYLVMEMRHARALVRKGYLPRQIALLGYWSRPQRLHLHDPHQHSHEFFRTCFTLIHSAVDNLAREYRAAVSR
jgi:protein-tyrosine phosphatase